jgi:oxalate decarboxylase/phosphoglucose isomerase-like protein (cupin superfamily)
MDKTGTLSNNGASIAVGGDRLTFRVTSEQSAGALTAVEVRMRSGGGPPMLHRHDAFEVYRVEHGELTFHVEDDGGTVRRTVGRRGAVVSIPGGREHTIRNESGGEARAFVVFSPGAEMERFVREAGALAERGSPAMEEVLAVASSHGIEMTRPLEATA